jgi:hypothetical protein
MLIFCCSKALVNTVENKDTAPYVDNSVPSLALELDFRYAGILRKRNRILKIADKHGWGTVQEYLDSPLADDKDDAANLRTAIARAARLQLLSVFRF